MFGEIFGVGEYTAEVPVTDSLENIDAEIADLKAANARLDDFVKHRMEPYWEAEQHKIARDYQAMKLDADSHFSDKTGLEYKDVRDPENLPESLRDPWCQCHEVHESADQAITSLIDG